MSPDMEDFTDALEAVLNGSADAAQRCFLDVCVREDPGCRRAYCEQMELHILLRVSHACEDRSVAGSDGGSQSESARTGAEVTDRTFSRGVAEALRRSGWRKIAALAALLLGGAVLVREWVPATAWKADLRIPSGDASVPPVQLVHQSRAERLELPHVLPGYVKLAKGEAKVRLSSGVELSLLGPLSLEVESGMEARLDEGRLLAWVPPRASGFTVRAPGLTAWDIGTVFSVAAEGENSSLFVFKGSVQVLDASGDGVDLCEAGEGVRSIKGRTPFKVATEGGAAGSLFAPVCGHAALAQPQKALAVARQITELWIAKYVPEEASLVRSAAQREAAIRNAPQRLVFQKSAWVRSPASRLQEGSGNMKIIGAASILAAAAMGAQTAGATSGSVVVNASPCNNRHWMTVFTNEVPLVWEWPSNAVRANLAIVGMSGAVATNFTGLTTNYLWRAFAADKPIAEDVYDLTLTFLGGGDAVVGVQTSRLAVVTGAFGKTSVDTKAEATPWPTISENVVIPYNAGWAQATVNATNSQLVIAKQEGLVQTNRLPATEGYFGWKIKRSEWGYGTFSLALMFPGTVTNGWDAVLMRVPDGMMIRLY